MTIQTKKKIAVCYILLFLGALATVIEILLWQDYRVGLIFHSILITIFLFVSAMNTLSD